MLPIYIGDDRSDEDAFKVLPLLFISVGCLVKFHYVHSTMLKQLNPDFILRCYERGIEDMESLCLPSPKKPRHFTLSGTPRR